MLIFLDFSQGQKNGQVMEFTDFKFREYFFGKVDWNVLGGMGEGGERSRLVLGR